MRRFMMWRRMRRGGTATMGGIAPTITQPATFPLQPVVGVPMVADPPVATGSPAPTITVDGWWRGDPATDGLQIGVETDPSPDLAAILAGTGAMALDVSDLSTLWQDEAATVPVTADGQVVRAITDALGGAGIYVRPSGLTDELIFREDYTSRWLEKTGPNVWLNRAWSIPAATPGFAMFAGIRLNAAGSNPYLFGHSGSGDAGPVLLLNSSSRNLRPAAVQVGNTAVVNGSVVPLGTDTRIGLVYDRPGLLLSGYIDGASNITTPVIDADLVTSTNHQILANNSNSARSMDALLHGMVTMNAVPTTEQIAAIETWLAARQNGLALDVPVTTLTYDAPKLHDYGRPLAIRVRASNGIAPDATADTLSLTTGARKVENWPQTDVSAVRTEYQESGATILALVSEPLSPTQQALAYAPGSDTSRAIWPIFIRTLAMAGGVEEYEALFAIRTPPAKARSYIRLMEEDGVDSSAFSGIGSAGVQFRSGILKHMLPGDINDDSPVSFGTYTDDTEYMIRHRVVGDTSSLKVWLVTNSEPVEWTSVLQHTGPIQKNFGWRLGSTSGVSSGNPVRILGWSTGLNIAPPPIGLLVGQAVPDAFTLNDWKISDAGTGGSATLEVVAWPSDNGSQIQGLQYQVDGGAWIEIGVGGTTFFNIPGLTNDVSHDITLRLRNAVGTGLAGDTKSVTVTAVPAGAPEITAEPLIFGEASVGTNIMLFAGMYEPAFTSMSARLQTSDDGETNWTDVIGSDSTFYVLQAAEQGKYIRHAVDVSNITGAAFFASPKSGPVAASPTTMFGANTAVGAGGISVPVGDGVFGEFTVANGVATPNVSPLTPGVANVNGHTIEVVAGQRHVSPMDNVQTQVAAAVASGETAILLRAGDYGNVIVENISASPPVTIRPESVHAARFTSFTLLGSANVILQNFLVTVAHAECKTPNNGGTRVNISNSNNITIENFIVSNEHPLDTGNSIITNNCSTIMIKDSRINGGLNGVRLFGTSANITVQNCDISGVVQTPINIGSGGSIDGYNVLGNRITRHTFYPTDECWTDLWAAVHGSAIGVRNAVNVKIEDNIIRAGRINWIQFYAGEFGLTYEYGNVSVKRNLIYDGGSGWAFLVQAGSTSIVGPFNIENNTMINGVPNPDWPAVSADQRFGSNAWGADGGQAFVGSTFSKNILITQVPTLPENAEYNIIYTGSLGTADPTKNICVVTDFPGDPTWIDTELFEAGTFNFSPAHRQVLEFLPKIDGPAHTMAPAGEWIGYKRNPNQT